MFLHTTRARTVTTSLCYISEFHFLLENIRFVLKYLCSWRHCHLCFQNQLQDFLAVQQFSHLCSLLLNSRESAQINLALSMVTEGLSSQRRCQGYHPGATHSSSKQRRNDCGVGWVVTPLCLGFSQPAKFIWKWCLLTLRCTSDLL